MGFGAMFSNATVTIKQMEIVNSSRLEVEVSDGTGIGVGLSETGTALLETLIINSSDFSITSGDGNGIGSGVLQGHSSLSLRFSQIDILNSNGKVTSGSSAGIGSLESGHGVVDGPMIVIDTISIQNSTLVVSGEIGFGLNRSDSRISFIGPLRLECTSLSGSEPCATSGSLHFEGDSLDFEVNTRSLGSMLQDANRTSVSPCGGRIVYGVPSVRERVTGSHSLHFGRIVAGEKAVFSFSVFSEGHEEVACFPFNTSSSHSSLLFVPNNGSYRVQYGQNCSHEQGWIRYMNGTDTFPVNDGELYVDRVQMADVIASVPFEWEDWHIFLVVIGVLILLFCAFAVYLVASGKTGRLRGGREANRSVTQVDVGLADSDARVEKGAGDAAMELTTSIAQEYAAVEGVVGFGKWAAYLAARIGVMLMMLIISYMGFVSFFFFSILTIVSFVVALFTNSFCNLPDLAVQILMCFYFIPSFELLVSVNLEVIASFFSRIWSNLDLSNVAAALESHTTGKSKFFVIFRLAWDFFYFVIMGFLFIICLVAPDSNISVHLRSPFAVVCLIVPLFALLKPIFLSWYVLFFDRRFVSMPAPRSEQDEDPEIAMSEADPAVLDGNTEQPAVAGNPEPFLLSKVNDITEHKSLVLFDSVGILKDKTWITFLCSPLTGFARPQFKQWRTFIAFGLVFMLLLAVCITDGFRMNTYQGQQESDRQAMANESDTISAKFDLGFEPVVHPHQARQTSDWGGLAVRILLVILVFPFTVLSNCGQILVSRYREVLSNTHGSVFFAKIIGLVIAGFSIVALILGAVARGVYPWYSLDKVISGEVSLPVNLSDPACGSWETITFEDPHTLCSLGLSNWSLLQLAALPMLGEASAVAGNENSWLLDSLACLTDIPLLRNDPNVGFNSTAVLAFDSVEKKFALAMPAVPFARDFGIVCENFLTSYYHTIIDMIIPFYSIAYNNFLADALTTTAQTLISGILGPGRLSAIHLDSARLYAGIELQIAWEVLEALGLSAERPVMVGHGANGLLAKVLDISKDPWRVSFEAPKVTGTPIAALANRIDDEAKRSRIFNFYSDGSLYALFDEGALINTRIPDYGLTGAVPPNPFDTFCFTVAACAHDNRFDSLCNDVLGDDVFAAIWTELGRGRLK
jgi:hypothetical protein